MYSTTPPAGGLARVDDAAVQATVDALPAREPAGAFGGTAHVEAPAVEFEREGGPELAIVSRGTGDGRRALANTGEPDVLHSMTEHAWEGRTVEVRFDGTNNTIAPD
jgi:hypothetical protein